MNNNIYSDKIKKHRRLKFGAFAVGLTVAVIALVVIINVVFSALSTKFMWYKDMTKEQIYGITQQSIDLLDDYRGTGDFKISIVFCQYADQLDSVYELKLIHNLAKQYAEEFDFVEVEYVDIVNHPESVNQYLATSVSNPKRTSVYIVKHDLTNPEEEMKQSKIYGYESFYTIDSDTNKVFAFNGEYKITAGILQLVGDNPIAYFVTGHSEDVNPNSVMWSLFAEAGYDVRTIDLSKENIDDAAKILIINCPKNDYMGANDTVNEIKKIDNFLDNFGGLMVFMDAESGEMEELDSFLEEWGVSFGQSQIVDLENSLSVDGTELVAEYVTEGTGASLTSPLRELSNLPKAIFNKAKPINYTYERVTTDGQYHASFGSSSRYISSVFTTSSSANALSLTDPTAQAVKGPHNLMTITVDSRYINNEPHYSYVLAAGTSSFADDKYIGSRSYANRDVIFNIMKSFGKKTVPIDINFKVFEEEALTITKAEANRLTVVYTVLPSLAIFVVGIVVYTRRRYL